ncbi:MAG: putative quinol monooxygenase [Acidobacteriota bacterium]|nr:putative quinol monooxygenase [Acidobacteriota bacterium]
MFIVQVYIKVKPDCIEAFKQASIENAHDSIEEPGIDRFELIQSETDHTAFVLTEIYGSIEDQAKHKETAHFKNWQTAVDSMMAEPRYAVKYQRVFPT